MSNERTAFLQSLTYLELYEYKRSNPQKLCLAAILQMLDQTSVELLDYNMSKQAFSSGVLQGGQENLC